MIALCLLTLSLTTAVTSQAVPCPACLFPLWYKAINANGPDLCSIFNTDELFKCIGNCLVDDKTKPESYKIRQLTQLSDIYTSLVNSSCTLSDPCLGALDCLSVISNYDDGEGKVTHAPYNTVFDFNCDIENGATAKDCILSTGDCSPTRLSVLENIVSFGLEAACDNPRRCVKHANIFEVKPGTGCTEYLQEAAAYGPSTGQSVRTLPGVGFDTSMCRTEFLNKMNCTADPEEEPIFSEFPPTTAALPIDKKESEPLDLGDVDIDITASCEKCLQPVWERAVTNNGSYLCDTKFQLLVSSCLRACRNYDVVREQLHTEVLVKISDLNKAFQMNGCATGYAGCSSKVYTCTENLARFQPRSAPHVTVNTLACGEQNLIVTLNCISDSCTNDVASLFQNFVIRGYSPICNSELRCMTYGNIYEYVPMSQIDDEEEVPCAHYRQAPVNGWHTGAIGRVQGALVFNTNNCQPDHDYNVICPPSITEL